MCDDYYHSQHKFIHTKYTMVVIIVLLNLDVVIRLLDSIELASLWGIKVNVNVLNKSLVVGGKVDKKIKTLRTVIYI